MVTRNYAEIITIQIRKYRHTGCAAFLQVQVSYADGPHLVKTMPASVPAPNQLTNDQVKPVLSIGNGVMSSKLRFSLR